MAAGTAASAADTGTAVRYKCADLRERQKPVRRFAAAEALDSIGGETRDDESHGDLALTSTRLTGGGATAEVARRQPDGS